jgi:hypothetical protein
MAQTERGSAIRKSPSGNATLSTTMIIWTPTPQRSTKGCVPADNESNLSAATTSNDRVWTKLNGVLDGDTLRRHSEVTLSSYTRMTNADQSHLVFGGEFCRERSVSGNGNYSRIIDRKTICKRKVFLRVWGLCVAVRINWMPLGT